MIGRVLFGVLLPSFTALFLAGQAQALEFKITNNSGLPANKVYVNVSGAAGQYEVSGAVNDQPQKLSGIPGQKLTIDKLVSGRIYISYRQGVPSSVPFSSPVRFDWAELTVTPSSSDVANLTAVDQFGIGMRLKTFNASDRKLEELGTANSDRVFEAMQKIEGGPAATVKADNGDILRVLAPLHSPSYPPLTEYVQSMAGKTINLRTAFFGAPFTTSNYSGTFGPDGSITLSGTTNPAGQSPASIPISGQQLLADIYTGGNTPNNLQGAIYRDVLASFSTGMWGGKYGNDALDFCTNPVTTSQGSWCPSGFNKPAFGDARITLESYPACEEYAAVINRYSDSYGNPYSDASKQVTVSLDQPGTGGNVKSLELIIQPDQGSAMPVTSGSGVCRASGPTPGASVRVISVKQKVTRKDAKVISRVRVSGAGKITQRSTTGSGQLKTWCRTAKTSPRASTYTLACNLGKKGRQALTRRTLKLTLRTTFTRNSGDPVTVSRKVTIKRRR
ncbi:MAG: beta-1,3-glucanase family protein [Solirubrobacterales bacterium]